MHVRRITVLLVLAALGIAACGSSSKSAADKSTSTTAATAGSSGANGTQASSTSQKVSGDSGSSFCNAIRGDVSALKGTDFAGLSASDLKSRYEHLGTALSDAESKAPSQIKGDFHTFVTAFTPILNALAAANYDYRNIKPSDYTMFASLGTAQVKAASDHIEAYVVQVCHLSTTPST